MIGLKDWQDLEMSEIPEYLVKKSPCDYRVRWTLINLMMDRAKSKEIHEKKPAQLHEKSPPHDFILRTLEFGDKYNFLGLQESRQHH